jgi:glycine/D-amino acid oxidase-like deaminating enzyme
VAQQPDVVIAGGGVMGCATAYYLLLREPSLDVVVIEPDPTYARASTTLSDGNVRIQFNLLENIQMSQYAMEVERSFADDMEVAGSRPEVSARHQGNLFMVDAATRDAAEQGLALQQSLGCNVSWLSAKEVATRYPPFAGVGLVGGTLGPDDGSVDPHGVLHGYRRKVAAMGGVFIETRVVDIRRADAHVSGVVLADGQELSTPVIVNATGAWAAGLAATAGIDLPVEPVMRNVFIVDTQIETAGLPSAFVPSGLYLIPERDTTFLMAWSQPDDPTGFDFVVQRRRFYNRVWPELAHHFPAFDALEVTGAWAGLYAVNTLDGNAILGEWPGLAGLYLANGFSGHGFQHCHAVGRYLAELILGLEPSLDLGRLGPQRIIDQAPLHEHAGRII